MIGFFYKEASKLPIDDAFIYAESLKFSGFKDSDCKMEKRKKQ